MRKIAIVVFAMMAMIACKTDKAKEPIDKAPDAYHSSRLVLDWPGDYFGVLSCDTCSGTNVYIHLGEDSRYEQTMGSIDGESAVVTTDGVFSWSDDHSSIVIGDTEYKVIEGGLVMQSAEKDYTLTKVSMAKGTDGVYAELYKDAAGVEYQVNYVTTTKTPMALVTSKNERIALFQTEAWAKGAEYNGTYQGATYTLKSNGDGAVLTIDGKETALKSE